MFGKSLLTLKASKSHSRVMISNLRHFDFSPFDFSFFVLNFPFFNSHYSPYFFTTARSRELMAVK